MTLPHYYATGTASVANGDTTVTFSGALLGTAAQPNIMAGDIFSDPSQSEGFNRHIESVDYEALTAELSGDWLGTSMTADPYRVYFIGITERSTAQTRLLLEQLSVVEANGRGLFYRFSTTTTDSDPGAGTLRLNNATIGSATAAYLDNLDADGATVSTILDSWDDGGSSAVRGQLWIRSIADPSIFHAFNVTGSVVDGTGYRKLTLAYIGGSGSFAAGDEMMVMFIAKGDSSTANAVNILDYGADPTGVSDSLSAFNDAIAAGLDVFVPPGTYTVSGKVAITADGQKIRGAGKAAATVESSHASQPVFEIAADIEHYEISGMTIGRTVTATSGGHGISCVGYSQLGLLERLEIRNQWRGLNLGPTSYSHIKNVFIDNCFDDGIYATGTAAIGVLQWYMTDILSQRCEGWSYNFETSSGPSSTSMGDWIDVKSYASKLGDVRFKGRSGNPMQGIRWTGGFVGESGSHGVYMDTYNTSPHRIEAVTAELAGIGACGRNNGTSATSVGQGFNITANNGDVNMIGCVSLANSHNGLYSGATWLLLSGCEARLNGAAGAGGETTGFFIGAGRALITGCASRGQNFGVYLTADGGHLVSSNDLNDNVIAGIAAGVTLSASVIGRNLGTTEVANWPTSAFKIDTNGYVASFGGRIKFPGTQSPSSDVNTLDDYEEFTWTPSLVFSGNSVGMTYTSRSGRGVKIGRTIYLWGYMQLSAKGSSTGNAAITGLPVAAASDVAYYGGGLPYYGGTSGITNAGCAVVGGAAAISLYSLPGNLWNEGNFTNSTELVVSVMYQTVN